MSEHPWTDEEFCRAVRQVGRAMGRAPGTEYAPIAYVACALAGRADLVDGEWAPLWAVAEPVERVARRKFRRALRRGLVSGCTCGCRGDVELTPAGIALLEAAGERPWDDDPDDAAHARARADTPRGQADAHAYTSTACFHDLHARCRLVCKFCDVPCMCACHDDADQAGRGEVAG